MTIDDFKFYLVKYIRELTWQFKYNDPCSIYAKWPDELKWEELKNEIQFLLSFEFSHLSHKYLCILQPARNQILISIENDKKHKLFDLIKDYQLSISYDFLIEDLEYHKKYVSDIEKRIQEIKQNIIMPKMKEKLS